jgi:hypothetical protein
MSRRSTSTTWHGFSAGQRVVMIIETKGATADDEEVVYPPGARAIIDALADFGKYQGKGVDVTIGEGDRTICNSFDDRDVEKLGGVPFLSV